MEVAVIGSRSARQSTAGRRPAIGGNCHAAGLDIGATGVRVSLLSARAGGDSRFTVTAHSLAHAPLPRGAVVDGVIQEEKQVLEALNAVRHRARLHGHRVVLGVSNPQTVVRDLTLPDTSLEMQRRALPFQAKAVIALPVTQALLDFVPLHPTADGQVEGLLVATPKDPVITAVRLVERAGMHVGRVDLATLATLRACASGAHPVEAVVDIGADLTTIVIHAEGVPRVVRTITQGGHRLTDRLADELALAAPDAEQLKCEIGLTDARPEVSRILREQTRQLLGEIRSSCHYFASNNAEPVGFVSLTGGGALLPGLAETIADRVGVPTAAVPPLHHVADGAPDADVAAASAVSVGLALGAAA